MVFSYFRPVILHVTSIQRGDRHSPDRHARGYRSGCGVALTL
jgi:hypothetical protein